MICLWCDAPSKTDVLCPECRAVNDHPLFHCPIKGHLPTLGDACCECTLEAERVARLAKVNAPAIESLRKILRDHVREMNVPWPGCEFGKAIVGNAILGALADLGCDKGAELRRAKEDYHVGSA